jgi:hypothetical protein
MKNEQEHSLMSIKNGFIIKDIFTTFSLIQQQLLDGKKIYQKIKEWENNREK